MTEQKEYGEPNLANEAAGLVSGYHELGARPGEAGLVRKVLPGTLSISALSLQPIHFGAEMTSPAGERVRVVFLLRGHIEGRRYRLYLADAKAVKACQSYWLASDAAGTHSLVLSPIRKISVSAYSKHEVIDADNERVIAVLGHLGDTNLEDFFKRLDRSERPSAPQGTDGA